MLTKHIYARYLERKKKNSKMPGFAVSAIESIRRNPRFAKFHRMYRSIPSITSSTTSSPKKVIVESFQSAVSALFSVSTLISLYSIDTVNEFRTAAHDTFGPKWFSLPSRPIEALTPEIDAEAAADAAFHQLMAEEALMASSRSGNGFNVDHDLGSKMMNRADRVANPLNLQPIELRSDDVDAKMIPLDIPMEAQPARCLSTMKVVTMVFIGLLAVSGCTALYLSDGGMTMKPMPSHEATPEFMPQMDFVDLQGDNQRSLLLHLDEDAAQEPSVGVSPAADNRPVGGVPQLHLYVRLSDGDVVSVEVPSDGYVQDVMDALPVAASRPMMPPQRLSFAGEPLLGTQILADTGVSAEATLYAQPTGLKVVYANKSDGSGRPAVSQDLSKSYLVRVSKDYAKRYHPHVDSNYVYHRMKDGNSNSEDCFKDMDRLDYIIEAEHRNAWDKFINTNQPQIFGVLMGVMEDDGKGGKRKSRKGWGPIARVSLDKE